MVQTPANTPAVYQPPEQGPFKCSNCKYFTADSRCTKPQLKRELGTDKVNAEGCCNFYEKGSSSMPISGYYKGSGNKVMSSMKKRYGAKKGKQVFYATANARDLVGPSSKVTSKKGMK